MCTGVMILAISLGVILWSYVMIKRFPDTTEMGKIKNGIWQRYTKDDFPSTAPGVKNQKDGADAAISYAERVIDRQINKARGILPFNSIVIAAFGLERTKLQAGHEVLFNVNITSLLLFAMFGLAVSSVLCLALFFVRWAKSETYGFFHYELESTLDVLLKRSKIIEVATIISLSSLIVGGAVIGLIELVPKT
jgi:hypothetical protein